MKKLILIIALIALSSISVFASSDVDLDFGFDGNVTYMQMDFLADNGDIKTSFNTTAGAFMDIFIKHDVGINILFLTDFSSLVKVGAGFAYTTRINPTTDFRLSVGPFLSFENNFILGVYSRFDFDFHLTRTIFLAVGAEVDMEFLKVQNGEAEGTFNTDIILPKLGVGFNF